MHGIRLKGGDKDNTYDLVFYVIGNILANYIKDC
jgi:hypothetical protein